MTPHGCDVKGSAMFDVQADEVESSSLAGREARWLDSDLRHDIYILLALRFPNSAFDRVASINDYNLGRDISSCLRGCSLSLRWR